MTLTVLMNAGPWLPVPPPAYGGIENVIATLVPELRRAGVRVVLATVGESTLPADEYLTVFDTGRFEHITDPYNQVNGIAHAHMQAVVGELRRRRDVDLVHDHQEVVGLATLAAAGPAGPPALHTLHWDLGKHPDFYGNLATGGRVFVNGVSRSQLARAPRRLQDRSLGAVHLGTPLAADPTADRDDDTADHFVVLGRIAPMKGQDVAARICRRLGLPLVLAGPVTGHHAADAYFRDSVAPHVDGTTVRWVGPVGGEDRDRLLRTARAAVFPIQWEEPGGTAVVEALAVGTPVVALRRGVMPELIDHGRTGFLADDEEQLAEYLLRVDEIDPRQCRREAERRFTPAVMARRYLDLYEQVLSQPAAAERSSTDGVARRRSPAGRRS
jgi:glycosyltransferase involved in cell wall biosynthesis